LPALIIGRHAYHASGQINSLLSGFSGRSGLLSAVVASVPYKITL
jgi:hypothetical protein